MLIDSRGVIRKLDEPGVLPFLRANRMPLVVYGAGIVGTKVLGALQKAGIQVVEVVDGSSKKQGTVVLGHTIRSISDVEAKYNDYILLVTLVKEEIFSEIVREMYSRRIKGKILWYHNYFDFDESLPIVIIGMNKTGQMMQGKADCLGYLDYEDGGEKDYNGLPLYTFDKLKTRGGRYNFIICDKRNEDKIYWSLEQHDLALENVYTYHSPVFGVFAIEKYKFFPAMHRMLLFPYTCCLNKFYWSFTDEESRGIFRDACEKFFSCSQTLTAESYINTIEEMYTWENEDSISEYNFNWSKVIGDLAEFLHFLDRLDRNSVNDHKELCLCRDGNRMRLTITERDSL